MFRPRRQVPAAVRPRSLKRPRPTKPAADGAPGLDFVSHVENAMRGLLGLLGGAALILWRFVTSPCHFDRHADDSGRLARDVPPYTFLTLSTFAATSGLSTLLTTVMLAWFALVRPWADDAQEPLELPKLGDLVAHPPSVEDVITRGIPCVLLVVAVLGLLRLVLRRRSPEAAARFFGVALYIAGFQCLLATFALALVVAGWPSGSLAARAHVGDLGILLLPFIGAWPALLYALQIDKAWPLAARASPGRRVGRTLLVAAVALLTSVATFAPQLAVSWAMAWREVQRQAQPRPLMDAAVVAFEHVEAAVPFDRVTVLVTDRADRALHLARGPAWLRRGVGDADLSTAARIPAWQGGSADVLTIEPGHDAWIVLDVPSCPDTGKPDCGLKRVPTGSSPEASAAAASQRRSLEAFRRWTGVDVAYPTPPLASGQVGFVQIQSTGERAAAFAWLRGRLRP